MVRGEGHPHQYGRYNRPVERAVAAGKIQNENTEQERVKIRFHTLFFDRMHEINEKRGTIVKINILSLNRRKE